MKKLAILTILLSILAGTAQASLQSKLGELLGIEPQRSVMAADVAPVASETALTLWLLGTTDLDSPDNEFKLRAGVQLEDVEICFQSTYLGVHGAGQSYGVFVALHLEGDIASWMGRPYIGYSASLIDSEDGSAYGPVLGTVYSKIFVLEYQYRDFSGKLSQQLGDENDAHKLFIGARVGF